MLSWRESGGAFESASGFHSAHSALDTLLVTVSAEDFYEVLDIPRELLLFVVLRLLSRSYEVLDIAAALLLLWFL